MVGPALNRGLDFLLNALLSSECRGLFEDGTLFVTVSSRGDTSAVTPSQPRDKRVWLRDAGARRLHWHYYVFIGDILHVGLWDIIGVNSYTCFTKHKHSHTSIWWTFAPSCIRFNWSPHNKVIHACVPCFGAASWPTLHYQTTNYSITLEHCLITIVPWLFIIHIGTASHSFWGLSVMQFNLTDGKFNCTSQNVCHEEGSVLGPGCNMTMFFLFCFLKTNKHWSSVIMPCIFLAYIHARGSKLELQLKWQICWKSL